MRIARQLFLLASATLLTACGALLALEPLAFDDGASTSDAGLGLDADGAPAQDGATRPDAGDASQGPFCSSDAHDFCDDFEGKRPIQGSWTYFHVIGTSTAAIEAGTFIAEITPSDAAALEVARTGFVFEQPWALTDAGGRRRIDIRFRANVEACPDYGAVEPTSVALNAKEVNVVIFRQAGNCIAHIREIVVSDPDNPVYRTSPPLLVPVGTWAEYGLELPPNAPGTGGQAKLHVDGQSVTFNLTPTAEASRLYLLFGLFQRTYSGANGRVRLDDFRVDYLE